ncbi:MAG: hypothetical protein PHV60_00330 [bacterium]|nr:hypothetical protein [bacterium]
MKKYKYLAVIILLIVLIMSEYHYIKRDINRNTKNILDGSYLMNSQITVIDPQHREIYGTENKEGFLAYGPYISLRPGRYTVKYALLMPKIVMGISEGATVGYCDVNVNGYPEYNQKIELKLKDLAGGRTKLTKLNFTVPAGNPTLEFRIYKKAGIALSLTGLQLRPTVREIIFSKESKWVKFNMVLAVSVVLLLGSFFMVYLLKKSFGYKYRLKIAGFIIFLAFAEWWWFSHKLLLPIFPGASMSTQIGIIDTKHSEIRGIGGKNGYLTFGPYLPLAEGNYAVIYKLKLNNYVPRDNPNREIGVADINIVGFEKEGVTRVIKAGDFNGRHRAKVVMRFKVPPGMPGIECRIFQYGGNDLSLISIRAHTTDYIKKYYKIHLDFIGLALLLAIVFI